MVAQRQTVIGLTAGLILAVAIGVLGILHATAFDPATVKVEVEQKIEELNRIPETEILRKEALAKEILANETYRQHARAHYLKVERVYPRIHETAQLERAARKDVPPFLARCKDLSKVPPDDLPTLAGECRSLLRTYGSTGSAEALREAERRLQAALDAQIRCNSLTVLEITRNVQKKVKEGQFTPAFRLIEDFEKKYMNSAEFEAQLRESRQMVLRKAEAEAEKLLAEAGGSAEARRKAVQRLEGPDFKGLPLPRLETILRELRRP